MRDFIDDYIKTLSTRRRERVYDILSASQVEKGDLDEIVKALNAFTFNSPLVLAKEVPGGTISAAKIDVSFREAFGRLSELFSVSQQISLLLESNISTLTSEIKAIEDEISAMEKVVNNYAFNLADGSFYDFIYTETFNNETMADLSLTQVSDRTQKVFDATERATVNSAAGILTLMPQLQTSYSLSGTIVDSNCLGFQTSNTGIEKSLNASNSTGWRIAISSPRPISSSISGFEQTGAQVSAEFYLDSGAPCDNLLLYPFSDLPVEILQVRVYPDANSDEGFDLIDSAIVLDRAYSLSFPIQSISKFSLVLNQTVYKRQNTIADENETQYRVLYDSIENRKAIFESMQGKRYSRNKKVHKRIFLKSLKQDSKSVKLFRSVVPEIDFDVQSGPLSLDKILYEPQKLEGSSSLWNTSSKSQSILRTIIKKRLFSESNTNYGDHLTFNGPTDFALQNPIDNFSIDTTQSLSEVGTQSLSISRYEYDLGLRNIQIGLAGAISRGVFISKPLPALSDSGEVKIKVGETNYALTNSQRDSAQVTSVEYSITNKSTFKTENDWIPILPSNFSNVVAERFFINEIGAGFFRFPASLTENITLYKNGYIFQTDFDSFYIYSLNRQSIIGLYLPFGSYSQGDVFTCDYTPAIEAKVINFDNIGFGQSVLASAFDDSGAGETFTGTQNSRTIVLAHEPFIDWKQVQEHGGYSSSLGFTGVYQPISVILSSGVTALNQTNYKGKIQNSLAVSSGTVPRYIHSKNSLIFDRVIDSTFTVYYQYLPSNLRFRVVLRSNDISFVSPSVDFVQVKTKSRKADTRKEF